MHRLELRIPPGVVSLTAMALMFFAAWAWPGGSFKSPWSGLAAAFLAALGAAVALAGVAFFRRAKTTLNPLNPGAASKLVTGGVHAYTRNPMYLGMALIVAGWGAYLSHLGAIPILAAFVWYLDRFQIRPEERRLLEIFGDEFQTYRSRVRRWI